MKYLRRGTKCRFSVESGNPPVGVTVAGHERHNGMTFYRLQEVAGLFLRRSLTHLMDYEIGCRHPYTIPN